jgi:hypothetical protein
MKQTIPSNSLKERFGVDSVSHLAGERKQLRCHGWRPRRSALEDDMCERVNVLVDHVIRPG